MGYGGEYHPQALLHRLWTPWQVHDKALSRYSCNGSRAHGPGCKPETLHEHGLGVAWKFFFYYCAGRFRCDVSRRNTRTARRKDKIDLILPFIEPFYDNILLVGYYVIECNVGADPFENLPYNLPALILPFAPRTFVTHG